MHVAPPGTTHSVGAPIAVIKASLADDHAAALSREPAAKPGDERRWNELQNTPKDIQLLTGHLLREYKRVSGKTKRRG